MQQHDLELEKNEALKKEGKFDEAFATTHNTFAGFPYDFQPKNTFEDPPEVREKFWHQILNEQGGFRYWLNGYKDIFFNPEANLEVRASNDHEV